MPPTDLSIFAANLATASVSYDPGYDNGARSLTAVACSDGSNGLMTRYNWTTQGDIPSYPYISGFQGISGWNSLQCGTCYSLTYNGTRIHILAVDYTASGFTIAEQAMNDLTNGNAKQLGRVDAEFVQVDVSECNI